MELQIAARIITSILVVLSLPLLFILLKELLQEYRSQRDVIQVAILVVYLTFIMSGLITLYINIDFFLNGLDSTKNIKVALFRNVIKQLGILFVSWWLYKNTRKGGART